VLARTAPFDSFALLSASASSLRVALPVFAMLPKIALLVGALLVGTSVSAAPPFKVRSLPRTSYSRTSLTFCPPLDFPPFSPIHRAQRKNPHRRQLPDISGVLGDDGATSTTTATAPVVSAPVGNAWKELSYDEAESVVAFLYTQPELNLTAVVNATAWDNNINIIDLAVPNKSVRFFLFSLSRGEA
jgi:hypothetical protein